LRRGRDPFQTEDIWQYLYRGAYWRGGPITMSAIAAVDVALWDIKAKTLNTPVYNLLGGKCRTGVMVYGHANGADIHETVDGAGKYIEMGYPSRSCAVGHSWAAEHLRSWPRKAVLRTGGKRPAARERLVFREILGSRSQAV